MNEIKIKLLASIADPETFWEITYRGDRKAWTVNLTDCEPVEAPTLADVINNDQIPRATRAMLRDLLTAAELWPELRGYSS